MIATAIPQEATTPKVWNQITKAINRGILSSEIVAFFERTRPALRLATKTESVRFDSVNNAAVNINVREKTIFCLTKPSAGDQKFRPARKIAAITKLKSPVNIKLELSTPWGFSARAKKRMMEKFIPAKPKRAMRLSAATIAEPNPTSVRE